jgi:hypothetical protein
MVNGSLSREKNGRDVGFTTTPFSAEVKESVELYLYSLSGSSRPVIK